MVFFLKKGSEKTRAHRSVIDHVLELLRWVGAADVTCAQLARVSDDGFDRRVQLVEARVHLRV